MNIRKLAKYFSGNLPNSKAIPIADFVSILENNLEIDYEGLKERKHKSGSVITDYINLLQFLLDQSADNGVIGYLLEYFDLPKDFLCPIDFTKHIIQCAEGEEKGLMHLSEMLDSMNETDFSRFIVMPLLHRMGYSQISYKGKVNETDYGNDFYPMQFTSPGGITHYVGVQVKATKMTQGDTSKSGDETNKLISELNTAFKQPHITIDGEQKRLSEMIVVNSKTINETTREKIFKDDDLRRKKLIIYDKDGVLSLVEKYNLDVSDLLGS